MTEGGMTLVTVDPTNAVAVTDYLTKARDWLATAVETTGPEQIAAAKAEIATAAEATKQLGLSKEIQHDAAEMVRRAEWALRRATKKAQEAGEVATRESNLRNHPASRNGASDISMLKPEDFFSTSSEYRDSNVMAELDATQFDEVIAEAKEEGNLSRANVARKAREKSGQMRATPRPAAEKSLNLIALYASKAARAARDLTPEQIRRTRPEADQWTADLRNSIEVLQHLVDSLDPEENK